MDIKQQVITEYLTLGTGYRSLAAKYGVSRTTINKWVQIHQGIHNLSPTAKQQKYYLSAMNSNPSKVSNEIASKPRSFRPAGVSLHSCVWWLRDPSFRRAGPAYSAGSHANTQLLYYEDPTSTKTQNSKQFFLLHLKNQTLRN